MTRLPDLEALTDEQSLIHYGRDWTRFWEAAPRAVVFPRTTADVVEMVRWARSSGVGLVPSGGRTGLSGGAVASAGEVVVSFEKMRAVLDFDEVGPAMKVEAGLPIGELQRAARSNGLEYPVDWSAADSSQAGGSVATNAGGIRVLRYGMTREWVRGLKVVTGTGDVLELNRGLIKNNAGPDLRHLLVGSEGTLGLITEVTFGLTVEPPPRSVLLLAFSGVDAIMPAFLQLRSALPLSAFEFFDAASISHVSAAKRITFPLDTPAPFLAVVEFDDPGEINQEKALAVFEQLVDTGIVTDGLISQSETQAEELWQWREAISESIAERTPYKNDLSVRIARVPEFLRALEALVEKRYPAFDVVWFGHIGDGNLHMNVLRPEQWAIEDFHAACSELTPEVFELVGKFEGSLSAEHGIGLLKRDWLYMTKPPAERALMKAIKQQFDPDGVLNPGKVLV